MAARMVLKDAAGAVYFDSTLATGGVPLGFYTVPTGGGAYSTTVFPTRGGVALTVSGGIGVDYTVDHPTGALRFTFPASAAGATLLLFAV